MDFAGNTCTAFADGLSIGTGRTCAVLVRLGVGAIDEEPFDIGIFHQRAEDSRQLAGCRPGIKALIDRVPAAKDLG